MSELLLAVTLVTSPAWWVDCKGSDRAIACARYSVATGRCEITVGQRYHTMSPRGRMHTLGHEMYHCAYPGEPHPEHGGGIDLTSWLGYSSR